MRKLFLATWLIALIPAHASFAQSQDPAPAGSQTNSKPASQTGASASASSASANSSASQTVSDADPSQPVSVAEAARLARTKKQSDSAAAKPTKIVLDDDNMPRGMYASDARPGSKVSAPGTPAGWRAPFSEYRGKVVLLDFWASWCPPCRSALPNLKRLQSVYSGEDFVVVSISEDDDQDTWRAFTASHQMTWPQRFDSDGSLGQRFGVDGLPTYVLLGRDGSVVQNLSGEDPGQSIMERLGPDIKKSLAATP